MPQFLIRRAANPGEEIRLPDEEARHLRDVLRMKVGETITVVTGEGERYHAALKSISKKEVSILIQKKLPKERRNGILKIGQALLKREKMELVIQKGAELGIQTLLPFSSSRTVVALKGTEKLARWQKIADEATKQCGRENRMIVEPPTHFKDLMRLDADLKIIFWEEEGESVREFFRRGVIHHAPTRKILALIGPEGGFSREEVEAARAAGFSVLSLGQRILRAETAAIVAISLIQYELENF